MSSENNGFCLKTQDVENGRVFDDSMKKGFLASDVPGSLNVLPPRPPNLSVSGVGVVNFGHEMKTPLSRVSSEPGLSSRVSRESLTISSMAGVSPTLPASISVTLNNIPFWYAWPFKTTEMRTKTKGTTYVKKSEKTTEISQRDLFIKCERRNVTKAIYLSSKCVFEIQKHLRKIKFGLRRGTCFTNSPVPAWKLFVVWRNRFR